MAMKKCKECGDKLSTKAKTCPHCGAPIPRSTEVSGCAGCLIVVIAMFVIIGLIPSGSPESPKQKPVENQSPATVREAFPGLDFRLLDEEKYDAPIKTQVVYHALVSGQLTEAGLRDVLERLFAKAIGTTGFKYNSGRVTHVFIYLYVTEAHFKSGWGQWIAMLSRVGEDAQKDIKVKRELIAQIGTEPEDKFGLSEDQRREIYRLIVLAEDTAREAAEENYPLDPTQALKVGQVFQLTKETPLMPKLDPADPVAAIGKMRRLPVDAYIKVYKIAQKNGTPWYKVKSIDRQKKKRLGTGWINGLALMGQGQVDVLEQMRRQGGVKEEVVGRYKGQICHRYKITKEQLSTIDMEGLEKNWPMPASQE